MSIWNEHEIEGKIAAILADVHYWQPDHHFGRPYLTAYQLAIVFAQRYKADTALIGQPIGGEGIGQRPRLTQYLARELSRRISNGTIDRIERAFLSNQHLADITFSVESGIIRSSLTDTEFDLSMFRLRTDGNEEE